MKITKQQLTKIIQEEMDTVLKEGVNIRQNYAGESSPGKLVDMAQVAKMEAQILNVLQQLYPDDAMGKKYFLNGLLNKVG